MAEEDNHVFLNFYDITEGLAPELTAEYLGKEIEAIWHTRVAVYGNEYYFGGGIRSSRVGTSPYGTPDRIVYLGVTDVPKDVFEMFLREIGPRYTDMSYSLMTHNCNHFSNEVAQYLVGVSIPDYILDLSNEAINSPMGPDVLQWIQQTETSLRTRVVPQAPPRSGPSTVAQSIQSVKAVKSKDEQESKTESKRNVEQQPEKKTDVAIDPLGDNRSKVKAEITTEFAAIMATGTFGASEAAALAARRVMERYGHVNTSKD